MTWGFTGPRSCFYAWFVPISRPCSLPACSGVGCWRTGGLSKAGRLVWTSHQDPFPMRLRSAITAGTDPAAGLPPFTHPPCRETRACPADSIRSLVARLYPGLRLPALSGTGHGPPASGRATGAAILRSAEATSALRPAGTWPRSRTGAGQGDARSAARRQGPVVAWSASTAALSAMCGPQDAEQRSRRDSSQAARPTRTAIAVHAGRPTAPWSAAGHPSQ
jgi:hypothetical protein